MIEIKTPKKGQQVRITSISDGEEVTLCNQVVTVIREKEQGFDFTPPINGEDYFSFNSDDDQYEPVEQEVMSKQKIPEVGQKVRLLLFNGEPCNEVVTVTEKIFFGFHFEPHVIGSCYFSIKSDLDQYVPVEETETNPIKTIKEVNIAQALKDASAIAENFPNKTAQEYFILGYQTGYLNSIIENNKDNCNE